MFLCDCGPILCVNQPMTHRCGEWHVPHRTHRCLLCVRTYLHGNNTTPLAKEIKLSTPSCQEVARKSLHSVQFLAKREETLLRAREIKSRHSQL